MSNLTLFTLADEYLDALCDLSDPALELDEATIADTLEGLAGDLETKLRNIGALISNLDAEAAAIKAAEDRMTARRRATENRRDRLKEYARVHMERTQISVVACPEYALRLRLNPESVQIEDEAALPAQFVRVKEVRSADKSALKAAVKAGQNIPGVSLVRTTRLEVR
jgi:hypothetical protein